MDDEAAGREGAAVEGRARDGDGRVAVDDGVDFDDDDDADAAAPGLAVCGCGDLIDAVRRTLGLAGDVGAGCCDR